MAPGLLDYSDTSLPSEKRLKTIIRRHLLSDQPKGELTLRTLAMPADTNPSGDIFGGWVLSQMDIAAGIAAGAKAQGRVTTVAIDAMRFHRPVKIGDVLCVYALVSKIGTTSITINLEAWVLRNRIAIERK
jgi:acyl-CoA thioesterase YciA